MFPRSLCAATGRPPPCNTTMADDVPRDRPLRVLFVTHNYPRFSGDAAGSFLHRLALALQQQHHSVHVLAPSAPGYRGDDVLDGVSIERVPYARPDRETLAYTGTMAEAVRGSWLSRMTLLQFLAAMRRAVRREVHRASNQGRPYDVVHAHWWFPAGLIVRSAMPRRAARHGGPALVITSHGSDVRLAASVAAAHPLVRWVWHGAQRVTSVSSWLAKSMQSIVPGMTVQVAPMPVDEAQFAPAHHPPAHAVPRDPTVLFVGRLNTQKGAADFLRAIAAARSRTTVPFRCAIVGDGPDGGKLRELAAELQVTPLLTWHGALPSQALPPLYQRATVTVMPSREEGLGLVAVESQLCATPVIAYESGGLPDAVSPAHGGTLVPAGNIDALADAIAAMVSDADRAKTLGEAGRRFVCARFLPSHVATQYADLYRQAIRARDASEHSA